jgi:hypothetical protein
MSALWPFADIDGAGWTVGAYLGWRLFKTIRFDAGVAYSGIDFQGTAGTASGAFLGRRALTTAGLSGSYRFGALDIEPSARVYALWEAEDGYTDSLGTAQADRRFVTGRASIGTKLTYRESIAGMIFAPYAGAYADYYLTKDDAAPQSAAPTSDGVSARVISGVQLKTVSGAILELSGGAGGVGAELFTTRLVRARASIPF